METFYIERDGRMLRVGVLAEIQPKTCAHCGAPFYFQDGRTGGGTGHASGVKYCTARHARAAAARAYRARRAGR